MKQNNKPTQEMVVDVYRMKTKKGAKGAGGGGDGNPMERFSGASLGVCVCFCFGFVGVWFMWRV